MYAYNYNRSILRGFKLCFSRGIIYYILFIFIFYIQSAMTVHPHRYVYVYMYV